MTIYNRGYINFIDHTLLNSINCGNSDLVDTHTSSSEVQPFVVLK